MFLSPCGPFSLSYHVSCVTDVLEFLLKHYLGQFYAWLSGFVLIFKDKMGEETERESKENR